MTTVETLKLQWAEANRRTRKGPPRRTSNPFFGVGPITDGAADEVEARHNRIAFDHWLEKTYRKRSDVGIDLGPFTQAELSRSMHRGNPADAVILDMMRAIHGYFEFPKSNRLAVGLGGGHSGFTVAALHLLSRNPAQQIFIDTPRPETEAATQGGFFRQSWGAQLVEMMQLSKSGDESRLHFASAEGAIPSATELTAKNIDVFFGVGHETTGATTYTESDIDNLLTWLAGDPNSRHAMLDATSLLGAMPWSAKTVAALTSKCCFFMPFQKAIGGIAGYYVISFTPQALALVETNAKAPLSPIPRQFKLASPADNRKPLTGERSVAIGPFYDPSTDKMAGGVINTFSVLAFAETTFGLKQTARRVGSVAKMNARSKANRTAIDTWLAKNDVLAAGVANPERRGAAVTLLKVVEADITDKVTHAAILAKSKQLLGYEGITHADGTYEQGLDVARYINAFPGTPGDYRAWIGGIRPTNDIIALLENLHYAWLRAKAAVIEDELKKLGTKLKAQIPATLKPAKSNFKKLRTEAETIATIAAALDSTSHPELRSKQFAKHGVKLKRAQGGINAAARKSNKLRAKP
jgi:phosphoserine aminotransferase